MSDIKLDENTKVSFFGTAYTIESFAEKFCNKDKKEAKAMLEIMLRKGEAEILEVKSSVQQCFEQVAKEQEIAEAVNVLDMQDELAKDAKAQKKREGKLTYPCIEVEFNKYTDAYNFMVYCQKELRLKDVSVATTLAGTKVIIKEITENELSAVNKYYTGLKVTAVVQDTMKSGVDAVTKTVEYASQNIIAPAAQIGIKGIASLFRSAAKVGTKIGATTITATSQSIQQTKAEIASDPDVIKAANELVNAKDALKRKTLGVKPNSGIKIIQ